MTSKQLTLGLVVVVMIGLGMIFLNSSVKHYDTVKAVENHEHRFETISQAMEKCIAEGLSPVIDTDACEFRCSASWGQKISPPLCIELNMEKEHP